MLKLAAPEWRKLGYELHILAIADTLGAYATDLESEGWSITTVCRSVGTLSLIKNVSALVRVTAPDVVHLHQEWKSLPLCYAVWMTGVPMVRTVHNNFPFYGILRIRKLVERGICRWLGCRYIAISQSVQDTEKQLFLNETKLCWNWFDASKYRPATPDERNLARKRLGIPIASKVIVSVGNGSDVKNYRVIVESLADLNNKSLHYYQIGNPHPQGLDSQIAQLLGLGDQVTFVGPRSDVYEWLRAADIYVMPSIYEGIGLAAIEAISAGCVCVFSDCLGLRDLRTLGIKATWVAPNKESFTAAIEDSLLKPCDTILLDNNSRIIRELFDVKKRALAYTEEWHNAINA